MKPTRLMIYFVALALLAMALHQATREQPFNWVVAALLALAAAGVLRGVRWGRRMALGFMWLLLVFAIGDVLPARIEVDEAYAKVDWGRFANVPAFEAANRINAYGTYLLMERELLRK